ncbi:hypothetical protein JCM1840_004576 [Sporobolomyces johnsonii]
MSISSAGSTHTGRTHSSSLSSWRPSHSHGTTNPPSSSSHHAAASGGATRHRLKPTSSISRQEHRLGVTTDYVDLSLHSAAAKGNVGLVQYALSHGQPVNSVLNGVLPLHAAASSGNETVVRMLIEAGADVNAPRLPRRYSNERSKTSGLAVGTTGSTALHFAAANGHVPITKLLLSNGANPRATDKYGLTPEAIALQGGHLEVADVLRSWSPPMDEIAQTNDDAMSIRSGKSSLRSLSKKRIHPQRSFDAIATKLSQHVAHPGLGLASSPSLASLTSLASSLAPTSSTSQISLGAATGRPPSSVPSSPAVSRRVSLSLAAKESTASARRPSLPSVWEKAAHPRTSIRQALGMSSLQKGEHEARRPSDASLGSTVSGAADEEHEGDGSGSFENEGMRIERAERRRSLDFHRPLGQDSLLSLDRGGLPPSSAPPSQSAFAVAETSVPPRARSRLKGSVSAMALNRASSASRDMYYRPRQSSQLSMGAESDGEAEPFEELESERQGQDGSLLRLSRRRAVSNPQPGARSPLMQQLHQNLLDDPSTTTITPLYPASTLGDTADASPSSSRPSTAGTTAALADHELSSDGGSSASRANRPAANDVRRSFLAHSGRDRTSSVGSTSSSFSRPPLPTTSPSPSQTQVATARNRSNSTASATPSSPGSSVPSLLGAQSTFSYAPSASTAPTSVAPSSPGARAEYFGKGRMPGGLEPLYETARPQMQMQARRLEAVPSPSSLSTAALSSLGSGDSSNQAHPTTRAQARSRVQKAERDLLSYKPASSSSASSPNGTGGGRARASGPSLKEQLAAYGRSLAIERELEAKERREEEGKRGRKDGAANEGYRIETIGTSAKPPKPSAASSSSPTPSPPIPTWRAIPTVDRLMPPPAHTHGRRSVSPSSASLASAPTPKQRCSKDPSPFSGPAPSSASTVASPNETSPQLDKPSHRRASTPTSASGSTVSNGHYAPSSGGGTVLGTGMHGVQFVAASPPAHHSSSHAHRSGGGGGGGGGRSDKSGTSIASHGTGNKVSVRDQVEEERREQERREKSVPRAVITAPGLVGREKKKGLRGWFGGK